MTMKCTIKKISIYTAYFIVFYYFPQLSGLARAQTTQILEDNDSITINESIVEFKIETSEKILQYNCQKNCQKKIIKSCKLYSNLDVLYDSQYFLQTKSIKYNLPIQKSQSCIKKTLSCLPPSRAPPIKS